jgi:hypothetical protein
VEAREVAPMTGRDTLRRLNEIESLHSEIGKGLATLRQGYLPQGGYSKLVEFSRHFAAEIEAFKTVFDGDGK